MSRYYWINGQVSYNTLASKQYSSFDMHGQCPRLVVEGTVGGERGAKVDEEVAHGAEQ